MTIARRVLPNTTYLLSRRCLDRRFYLKPSPELNDIYLYALASAQEKHGVQVHAFVCMSNHPHEVVTDVRGVLPDFMRDLRREIALAAKQLYQIPENVWTAAKPSAVELHGDAAATEIKYTLLNPVEAGLVAHASEWPGAISLPGAREVTVERPDVWFGDNRPKTLTLKLTPPPTWTRGADAWHEWLTEQLATGEEAIRRKRVESKVGVLGKERIRQQKPFDRPRNPDEMVPSSRNPTLATGGDGVLMKALVAGVREWRRAYCTARDLWLTCKDTLFPVGTWWVVQRAGASVA